MKVSCIIRSHCGVLLDLCYLQELDVILCVWKLLQLSVSPPQIIALLLQSPFSSTHCLRFLISDQPYQLRAASLNGADELSKDPLTVLLCCLCRALLGHTVIQASVSLNWDWDKLLFFSRLTLWDSTVSLSCWRSFSLCWILCWNIFYVSFMCLCWGKKCVKRLHYIIKGTMGLKAHLKKKCAIHCA